jgi:hypothetical protein
VAELRELSCRTTLEGEGVAPKKFQHPCRRGGSAPLLTQQSKTVKTDDNDRGQLEAIRTTGGLTRKKNHSAQCTFLARYIELPESTLQQKEMKQSTINFAKCAQRSASPERSHHTRRSRKTWDRAQNLISS